MVSRRGVVLFTRDVSRQWIEWMKDANLNLLGIHPYFKKSVKFLDKTIEFVKSERGEQLLSLVKEAGIDVEYELHAISWLIPRKLFKKNPEWFRVNKMGKRTNDFNCCVSSNEALEIITRNSKKLAEVLVPSTNRYFLWQDDGRSVFCNCDECSGYSASDQALMMVHAALEGIKEVNSKGKISYLAYNMTIEPPRKVKPEQDVFLEFAPISRKFNKSIGDESNPANVNYSKKLKDLIRVFGKDDAHVLEYWLDDSLFSKYMEFRRVKLPFYPEVLEKDVKFYKSLGFDSITSFAAFLDEKYVKKNGNPPIKEYGRILDA
ncbi:MAG: DUF4838 domain-containing protein [Candidatus Hodarchaeota archaeon]